MDEFIEYLRFPEIEKAREYTSVLEKHNIPFYLDDVSMRFKLVSNNNPWENQFILKLKESDIERAEKAFNEELDNEVKLTTQEHYMFSFADNDILNVIANQNEWTREEVKLAMKIANERKLDLSAQSIRSNKIVKEQTSQHRSTIYTTASWFWVIGVFTIANSVLSGKHISFHLPGLIITEISENVFINVFGEGNRFGFVATLIISAIFFLFARYGRRNKWIFLTGLIIYSFDAILVFSSPRWGQLIFIFIALWSMITSLVNTFRDGEKQLVQRSTNG